MSARIDIVNFGLSLLGADAITSLEDDSSEAITMKNFYYIARDAVLEETDWTFATKRFLPAKSTSDPEWGWSSAFPIPSDILRVTQVDRNWTTSTGLSDTRVRNPVAHDVEGREILCDENVIYCKGIRRISDEGIYSSLFVEAFSVKLAMFACYPITESNRKMEIIAALYTSVIKTAKSRDGLQSSTRRMRNQVLSRARR